VKTGIATNLDFVIAKTRAKHSYMYEGDRLSALVRHRTLPDLAHELFPTETFASHTALERRLVTAYADTLAQLWRFMDSTCGPLFLALGTRLQAENVKVQLRNYVSGRRLPPEMLPVIPLPEPFAWEANPAAHPTSVQDIIETIPDATVRRAAGDAFVMYTDRPVPLYLEAGLDLGCFRCLGEAWRNLGADDRQSVKSLMDLEADIHNLLLVLRARVNFNLERAMVVRLAVGASERRSAAHWVSAAADGATAREILARAPANLQRALLDVPAELGAIEHALWRVFYRTANHVYYHSRLTVGCPYAFAAVKRMELANLITIVEAVRYGLPVEDTLGRLLRPS
jgi:vacuolar-type H+-ATPase subunit C/Vma6